MASESGILHISFAARLDSWDALHEFIKDKVREATESGKYVESRVNGWSFLDGYNTEKHEIYSEQLIWDSIWFDYVQDFAMELVEKHDCIGFSGQVMHGWLNGDDNETEIEFTHIADSGRLWWHRITGEKEADESGDLYFGDTVDEERWLWDSDTKKKNKLRKQAEREYYPMQVPIASIILPTVIDIEGTAYAERTEHIEHVHVGDRLILKADWDSPHYWPVSLEVFNEQKESLGFLRDDGTNRLALLASRREILQASVATVTPLSQRKKNAKYALVGVNISIQNEGLSPKKQGRANELLLRVRESEMREQENKIKRDSILMELWKQKRAFPIRATLNSIRKTRAAILHIGETIQITFSPGGIEALNEKGEKIGSFNCLPAFHESDLDFSKYLSMITQWKEEGLYFEGETVVKFHARRLQAKITELILPSSDYPKGHIEVEIDWKTENN